ncbi:MAG: hypothetical protein P4N60_24465 [Verrucomicrobiae bacterium]|nr:hypothetical protein [Verrucomicrobiae bacterium]
MSEILLYASKRNAKSLWQQYRIYPDRLELQSWLLLHTLVVRADEIMAVEVRGAGLIWGIKLDHCNLCRHVLLTKAAGCCKRIGFSPDDPDKFAAICKTILLPQ